MKVVKYLVTATYNTYLNLGTGQPEAISLEGKKEDVYFFKEGEHLENFLETVKIDLSRVAPGKSAYMFESVNDNNHNKEIIYKVKKFLTNSISTRYTTIYQETITTAQHESLTFKIQMQYLIG